jgi:hypothetical protein
MPSAVRFTSYINKDEIPIILLNIQMHLVTISIGRPDILPNVIAVFLSPPPQENAIPATL